MVISRMTVHFDESIIVVRICQQVMHFYHYLL